MTGAVQALAGVVGTPPSHWTRQITVANSGVNFGYIFGSLGSLANGSSRQLGLAVITRFVYDDTADTFTFEYDETGGFGPSFTNLVVQDFAGAEITLPRVNAVAYSGFPLKGWIWDSADFTPPIWLIGTIGAVRYIKVQR